jgi:virginiamycin B lyase
VIVGPDGAPWITDGGQNAIVRVDPKTRAVRVWRLGEDAAYANLNTLTFDAKGRVWFTGQNGFYGRLVPGTNDMKVWKAPGGRGPYGIATSPAGEVYYASLAGDHIARIDTETGAATVIEPPTPNQGARRVWPDSKGRIWVSYWNTGQVGRYDPATRTWREWRLPGDRPHAYSVWVDAADKVWLSEWTMNAIVRFDPVKETFESFPSNRGGANVRQMLGRAGEAWGAESGNDRLVMVPAR